MKAITLYQPWATLMAIGAKRIETRPRRWNHTGAVWIHAGYNTEEIEIAFEEPFRSVLKAAGIRGISDLPLGKILALANKTGCVESEYFQALIDGDDTKLLGGRLVLPHPFTDQEYAFGNYAPERFGYVTDSVRALRHPIPATGHQSIWHWDPPNNWEELLLEKR